MGKWQHYIQTVYAVSGGAGFSHHVPEASAVHFDTVVVEGQLLLNRLLGTQSVRTVDDFVRAAQEHARDLVARTRTKRLILCFDDKRQVSGAKKATQKQRTESAAKSVRSKSQAPYTESELGNFFLLRPDPTEPGTSELHRRLYTPKAVYEDVPDLTRLRASRGGSAVLARATTFLVDAWRCTEYVHAPLDANEGLGLLDNVQHDVELLFVRRGVVEHGIQKLANAYQPPPAVVYDYWQPLQRDNESAPATLGEAEELVAHYALQRFTGRRVFVRCSDTDIVALLAHGVQRLQGDTSIKEEVWLDLNQGGALEETFASDAAASAAAQRNDDEQKKRKNAEYPRCIDMVAATHAFFRAAAEHPSFKHFTHPLHVLTFIASYGGSDNIEQLPLMTGEAWVKQLVANPHMAQWLARSVVSCERPAPPPSFHDEVNADAQSECDEAVRAFNKPLRTHVCETGCLAEFAAHQFALKMAGKEYEKVSETLANVPRDIDVIARNLREMQVAVREATEKRQKAANAKYEKDVAKYAEALAALKAEQAKTEVAPDGTLVAAAASSAAAVAKLKAPRLTQCTSFMPLPLDEVYARARRAHWQLQKIVNGTVANGVPRFDEQRDGKSVWGWDESGTPTTNIVPYARDLELI